MILDARRGVNAKWTTAGWAGVDPKVVDQGRAAGDKAVRAELSAEASEAWCGFRFVPKWNMRPFKVSKEAAEKGYVEFYLNTPADFQSEPVQVQVKLGLGGDRQKDFVTNLPFVPVNEFIEGGKLDNDPATWQKVTLPIPDWIKRAKGAETGFINEISIQFIRSARGEVLVSDVAIVTP